ncbi:MULTISPECIES: hypothetical protein [unclassified Moraxella]|uniref:calcium-binding protein n=1 Tax=unclassified Moraxella TaxID=2685852 RepID=UPI003AF6D378
MPLDLTNPNNQQLIQAGFNPTDIEKSPTLVNLLNRFTGTFIIGTIADGAVAKGNTIYLSKTYKNLITLAHELGHATGQYQQKQTLTQFDSPQDYTNARTLAEGEAMYYEFLVAKELGISHLKKQAWLDNQQTIQSLDLYPLMEAIINANLSQADTVTAFAKLNLDLIPSGQIHPPSYTYDEYNKLSFLNNKHPDDRISTDFQQAMNKAFDWNTYEAKSLVNKANAHYGTPNNDTLINTHEGGSVLGRQGQGDLLWGAKGNDILMGNTGKDILLGGSDNDVLVGGGGNDILAGGKGNDLYYFTAGFGQDNIVNAGGGVDNVYFADRGFDQLALVSQVKNDLTLNMVGGSDQLTVKDFFKGGDNASLHISFGAGGALNREQILGDWQENQLHQNQTATQPNSPSNSYSEADYQKALAEMLAYLHNSPPL